MSDIALEVLIAVGLFLLGGVRGVVSKWVVLSLLKLGKKVLLRSEHNIALYLHMRNQQSK